MNLRQQIVESKVQSVSGQLGIEPDQAFMRFSHSLITGISTHAFASGDLIDGGQDKQLDTISIDTQSDSADVYIIGCKHTQSHSSNDIILLANGLDWLFQQPMEKVSSLANAPFRDKIDEYRSVQRELGPSNIRVRVAYVTNGETAQISDECEQEAAKIRARYDNDTFELFQFELIGSDQLVDLLNAIEKRNRKVDARLRFVYDVNTPSIIRYQSHGLKGFVCSVPAREIARLVNEDVHGLIFDANIRRFLGTRGGINASILETCSTAESANLFWYLNNGITIVCDSFDPLNEAEDPHVKISNLQIVNGCQTATAIALAEKESRLNADAQVLVRVYETKDLTLFGSDCFDDEQSE
jgi:hypothetical protein